MEKKIRGNFLNEFRKGYKQSVYLQFITNEKILRFHLFEGNAIR